MKNISLLAFSLFLYACEQNQTAPKEETGSSQTIETITNNSQPIQSPPEQTKDFIWSPEKFADIQINRYQIPSFTKLSLRQQKFVYYLVQAGLSGRDIMWDQNYRHNLSIRRALEAIIQLPEQPEAGRNSEWQAIQLYARRVFFSNGIHHHYSGDKFSPKFSKEYFISLLEKTSIELNNEALKAIFDLSFDAKKINLNPNKDLVKDSAVNFYDPDITEKEVTEFYAAKKQPNPDKPLSFGLNSKLIRQADGSLSERVWHSGGMYGEAIQEIIIWLEKAVDVAENQPQADALKLLIQYYRTGDLKTWDDYNIAWINATKGDVDYIQSFIEVYNDPKGYRGSFENIVQIKDFEASARMQIVAQNAQWFEDNSTTDLAHKKDKVVGISYNVVNVAGESGDASPSTPVGVNLPNANWIRAEHGSKSVSLGNIVNAFAKSSAPSLLKEFAHDQQEIDRNTEHKELSGKLRTALHEVIGHASGKLESGVGTPKETLKNYSSSLEEARADLVALYFIMDKKLVEMQLLPSLDVGRAAYDSFILNGLMLQLRRIEPGKNIEQAHMRNRQMIAKWVFEKGADSDVISKVVRGNKTYFKINDYNMLRNLFGELLKEVQRIKSQGDYIAGRNLIENYGVEVDRDLHTEVLQRAKPLNIAPYGGFINPRLVPKINADQEITSIEIQYPDNFIEQMLEYAKNYSYLPNYN